MSFKADSSLVSTVVPAVNHGARRGVVKPDMLILHYTGMKSAAMAVQWLACAESKVSCHYVIDESGRVTQLVPEAERAWHAGVSCWHGVTDLNSASVGIEIQNPGHELGYHDFPDAQIDALAALCRDIIARQGIAAARVLAHSDVAPHRKIDPGEKFPWYRMAALGVGHWMPPSPVRAQNMGLGRGDRGGGVQTAQKLLADYGYEIDCDGVYGPKTERVVRAFQRHFRPARPDGRLDLSTLATLERLIAALPVAPGLELPVG